MIGNKNEESYIVLLSYSRLGKTKIDSHSEFYFKRNIARQCTRLIHRNLDGRRRHLRNRRAGPFRDRLLSFSGPLGRPALAQWVPTSRCPPRGSDQESAAG